MFCKKCGSKIPDDEDICPYCEEPIEGRQKKNENQQEKFQAEIQTSLVKPVETKQEEASNEIQALEVKPIENKAREFKDISFSNVKPEEPVDHGSIGYAILGFFVPLIGFILFLVWRNEKPTSSKQCGIGALISFILGIVFFGAFICCMIAFGNDMGRV